ncbi:hypothetical protein BH10BAC5_BH10BAC5_21980 [soil metagenome]
MRKIFLLFLIIFIVARYSNSYSQTYPYNLEIEQVSIPNAPALHSFAYAQSGGKWLFVGGRTNGLHGFSNTILNFPANKSNQYIWVVDPVSGQSWSRSVYQDLSIANADPLRAFNFQFTQNGDYLYMTGGYGRDSTRDSMTTFPKIISIQVSGIMNAVMNNQSIAPYIIEQTDTRFQIVGGEMNYMNGYYYLLGGQQFEGEYRDPPTGTFTQRYTDRVFRFQLSTATSINISNFTQVQDTTNLHRRDMNVVPMMTTGGALSLSLYGGVFTKGYPLPFLNPVSVSNTGSVTVDNSFQKLFSQYNCPVMSVYDSVNNKMHNTFFGGISLYYYDQTSMSVKRDTLTPFIKDISTITKNASGLSSEYLMPIKFTEYLGSNAEFIINPATPQFSSEIINLFKLSGRTFVGYIFGGIKALLPNLAGSSASTRIFKVYLTNTSVGIEPISSNLPDKFALSQNYPNPFNPTTNINFDITRSGFTTLKVYDLLGRELKTLLNENLSAGSYRVEFNAKEQASGMYFYKLSSGNYSEVKKMTLVK